MIVTAQRRTVFEQPGYTPRTGPEQVGVYTRYIFSQALVGQLVADFVKGICVIWDGEM